MRTWEALSSCEGILKTPSNTFFPLMWRKCAIIYGRFKRSTLWSAQEKPEKFRCTSWQRGECAYLWAHLLLVCRAGLSQGLSWNTEEDRALFLFLLTKPRARRKRKMGIMKNIVMLPFLPIKLAWKWTSGAQINGQQNGFAHFIGFLIVAGILYSLIGWGIMSLIDMFTK